MTTKRFSDAYNTGFEAKQQGEPRTANPYGDGTWESGEWFAGFDGDNQDPLTADEFASRLEFPVFFYAGVGCAGGQSIAILEGTDLPVELSEIEGEVMDGIFEASNLNDGSGAHGWKFNDWNSSLIYKIQIFNDEKIWNQQNDEHNAYA